MPKGTVSFALLAAILAGPGAVPPRKAARPAAAAPAPAAVIVLDTPEPSGWTGQPISLDLKDADVRDVLKAFAKLEKFNLAIDPDVKGSVTVRLENVPWDQALDVILRMNGLGYVLEGTIVRVGAPSRL